jgi:hypothetical protein
VTLLSQWSCGKLRRNTRRNYKNLHVVIEDGIHEKPFQILDSYVLGASSNAGTVERRVNSESGSDAGKRV